MAVNLMEKAEAKYLKKECPKFDIGDTVDVFVKIVEGDKERVQVFNGTVISRKGSGTRSMFTVRRIVNNEGVERIFPMHSPSIVKVEVKRSSHVRRSKLYFLRDRTGKSVRLREKWTGGKK
jgi:large subunit ribosomal protein L19